MMDFMTKVTYVALSDTTKKAVWIKMFIFELGVVLTIVDLVELNCDNNGVIAQLKESQSH